MWVIDGNNLLHIAREKVFDRHLGRQTLCELVGHWAKANHADALMVFDGIAPGEGLQRQMMLAGVNVEFSGPRSADDRIEELISQSAAPTSLHVVTSDKAIQSAARHRRCPCTSSELFATQLRLGSGAPPPAPVEPNSERVGPGQVDTAGWMEEFGYPAGESNEDETDLLGPVDP